MITEKSFFRQVMSRFATGVTVVTTRGPMGLEGLTVNAFSSVSLDPLLVLVCVDYTSHTLSHFRCNGSFAVNILSEYQEHLSRCFATPSQERYEHFCSVGYYVAATGAPIIEGVLAFVDASIVAEYPGGDHVILLGQVAALGVGKLVVFTGEAGSQGSLLNGYSDAFERDEQAAPLTYYRGHYRHLAAEYHRPSLSGPVLVPNQKIDR